MAGATGDQGSAVGGDVTGTGDGAGACHGSTAAAEADSKSNRLVKTKDDISYEISREKFYLVFVAERESMDRLLAMYCSLWEHSRGRSVPVNRRSVCKARL